MRTFLSGLLGGLTVLAGVACLMARDGSRLKRWHDQEVEQWERRAARLIQDAIDATIDALAYAQDAAIEVAARDGLYNPEQTRVWLSQLEAERIARAEYLAAQAERIRRDMAEELRPEVEDALLKAVRSAGVSNDLIDGRDDD